MLNIQKVSYGGWDNCYKVTNNIVDLIVTTDVGPRIIYYGFCGKENELCEVKDQMGKTGGDEWRIYGGHRLWHSPEAKPRSYYPDNSPVHIELLSDGVIVTQDTETTTGIRKAIKITLDETSSKVTLTHYMTNEGMWEIELAIWALTVMATGGTEIVPQETLDTDLLPNRMLSLWPYTKLNDPRVTWGEKYIMVKQDPNAKTAFKFGISNTNGWAAYANHNHLFIKKFEHTDGALYPDYSGSSYETYTIDFMLEMESLSPLYIMEPGDVIEHTETWELFDNVNTPVNEADVDRDVLKYI